MEVYIDLYFMINTSMDFLCLIITRRLLHRATKLWRMIMGAVWGGLYAVLALLLGLYGLMGFILDLTAACLITLTAFASRNGKKRRIWQTALVFSLVSMALGGIMTALYALLNRLELPFDTIGGDGASVWLFGLVALVSGILTVRGGRFLGFSANTRYVTVDAVLLGREVRLRAMVDSGNLLRDPISGRGVIVADRERLRDVLPSELLLSSGERVMERLVRTSDQNVSRLRLIPAQTATGGGLLLAIVPDALTVSEGGECYAADYLVAISALGEDILDHDAVMPLA